MSRFIWWAGGLIIYFLALLFTAPASLLDGRLDAYTAGRIRLSVADGTLWNGRGLVEIRSKDAEGVLNKALQWQLDKSQLLLLRLAWRLAVDNEAPRTMLTAGLLGIQISQLDINLPASALAQASPVLTGYGLDGTLLLHIDTLRFGTNETEGRATVQWQQASTKLAPVTPLGSYELQLQGTGTDIIAKLVTLQGPLQLHGSGVLGRSQQPSFTATASMPAEEYKLLAPFLRLAGVEQQDRSFKLQLQQSP